jgi:hypothetical protein
LNVVEARELSVEDNVAALSQHHVSEILCGRDGVKCSYLEHRLGKLLYSCSGSFNTEDKYPLYVGQEDGLAESSSC